MSRMREEGSKRWGWIASEFSSSAMLLKLNSVKMRGYPRWLIIIRRRRDRWTESKTIVFYCFIHSFTAHGFYKVYELGCLLKFTKYTEIVRHYQSLCSHRSLSRIFSHSTIDIFVISESFAGARLPPSRIGIWSKWDFLSLMSSLYFSLNTGVIFDSLTTFAMSWK